MVCPGCKKELARPGKFCPYCGRDLLTIPTPTPVPSPVPSPVPAPVPEPERKRGGDKKRLVIVIAVLVVVALAAGVLLWRFVLTGSGEETAEEPQIEEVVEAVTTEEETTEESTPEEALIEEEAAAEPDPEEGPAEVEESATEATSATTYASFAAAITDLMEDLGYDDLPDEQQKMSRGCYTEIDTQEVLLIYRYDAEGECFDAWFLRETEEGVQALTVYGFSTTADEAFSVEIWQYGTVYYLCCTRSAEDAVEVWYAIEEDGLTEWYRFITEGDTCTLYKESVLTDIDQTAWTTALETLRSGECIMQLCTNSEDGWGNVTDCARLDSVLEVAQRKK